MCVMDFVEDFTEPGIAFDRMAIFIKIALALVG